jgi:hypothetical protein
VVLCVNRKLYAFTSGMKSSNADKGLRLAADQHSFVRFGDMFK